MGLRRIGVSIPDDLLEKFDEVVGERGYSSRSEALRDAVRSFIVEHAWTEEEGELIGVITTIYDHGKRGLEAHLTDVQHDFPGEVEGSFHVHLTGELCLEVILLRGSAEDVGRMADELSSTKGVKQVDLVTTSAEQI